MTSVFFTFIQLGVILALAPFAAGLIRACKAKLAGRQGSELLLPYKLLFLNLKKEILIPPTSSWMFKAAPYLVLAIHVFMVFSLPLITVHGEGAMFSHFLVFMALVGASSAFLAFGAIDAGGAMGGMGGSRHLLITALSEPTLVFVFAAYALTTGESTIDGIVAEAPDLLRAPFLGLSVLAFILVALAENDRYPTDNPETSLELTMVREAMLSHYSGAYLSMLEYAAMVKYAVFVLLIGNLVLPGYLLGQGSGPAFVCFVGVAMLFKVTIASLAIALLEMTIAKMRLSRMQEYFLGAFFLSLAGFVLVLVSARL